MTPFDVVLEGPFKGLPDPTTGLFGMNEDLNFASIDTRNDYKKIEIAF